MRFYARSRSFSAPALHRLGGQPLAGMDASGRADLPPTVAALTENMWRLPNGSVAKRPGYRLLQRQDIPGKVIWTERFADQDFLFYKGENGFVLRRKSGERQEDRSTNCQVYPLRFGNKLLLLSCAEWIVVDEKGVATVITAQGLADITEQWGQNVPMQWELTQTLIHIPLLRAGTSPLGKGQAVEAPNRLTPLVQESFVYSKADQENKRNRFCLAKLPQVKGRLPVNAAGGGSDLSESDSAIRVATLSASARLEVRLTKTDNYGNTVSYWQEKGWQAPDNINAADAAFWISDIHQQALSMDGDDNIRITYYREMEQEDLYRCTMFTLYGVGGLKDRLFAATGHTIYYSAMDDPLYFAQPQYIVPGGSGQIRLLAGEDKVLTVLGDEGAWRISGRAETEIGEYALDASFSVSERLPSPVPANSQRVIAGGELLFYAKEGLCVVTPSGVLDERCIQVRSRRLEKLLCQEQAENIILYAWKDWIILGGEKGLYLLDLQRKIKSDFNVYSSHEYEGYFWPDVKVDCFVKSEKLTFYRDGNLYVFTEGELDEDYHDEYLQQGEMVQSSIPARWQSGLLFGTVAKCHRFVSLIVHMRGRTAIKISFMDEKGRWRGLRQYDGSYSCYRYQPMYYGQWCYGSQPAFAKRFGLPFSHMRGLRLQFENDVMDQSMGLETFILEYK